MSSLRRWFRAVPGKGDLMTVVFLWAWLVRHTIHLAKDRRFFADWTAGAVQPREMALIEVVLLMFTAAGTVNWIRRYARGVTSGEAEKVR